MNTFTFLLDADNFEQYQYLDSLPGGYILVDHSHIVLGNAAFAELVGYSKEALKSKALAELVHKEDCDRVHAILVAEETETTYQVVRLINANGQKVKTAWHFKTQLRSDGTYGGCLISINKSVRPEDQAFFTDTTLDTLRQLIDNSSSAVTILDKNGKVRLYNEVAYQFTVNETDNKLKIGTDFLDYMPKGFSAFDPKAIIEDAIKGIKSVKEFNQDYKGGLRYICLTTNPIVDDTGNVQGVICNFVDKSQTKKLSRELSDSQMLMQSVLEQTDSYFIYFDLDYNIVYLNRYAASLHTSIGFDIDVGVHLKDVYGEEGFQERCQNLYKPAQSGEVIHRNFTLKGETKLYMDVSFKAMYDDAGAIIGVLEFGKDVTPYVESIKEKERTKMTLDRIVDSSLDTYIAFNKDLEVMFYNNIAESQYDKLIGVTLRNGMHFDELYKGMEQKEFFRELYLYVLTKEKNCTRNFTLVKDEKEHVFEVNFYCLKNKKGKVTGLLACGKDISELYAANKALKLRESEITGKNAILNSILNSSTEGICAIDASYNVLGYNVKAQKEFGDYAGVDISKPGSLKTQLSDADFERWHAHFNIALEGGNYETVIKRKSTNRIYRNIYSPVINDQNEIVGALEVSRDITEYETQKLQLEVNEKRSRSILEHTPTGIAIIDLNGKITYSSPRSSSIMGYDKASSDIIGRSIFDFINPKDHGKLVREIKSLISGAKEVHSTYKVIQRDGELRQIEGIASLVFSDISDKPKEFLLAFNDVTTAIKTMEQLSLSRSNYEYLFQNMQEGVFLFDFRQGIILECNKSALDIMGYTEEEFLVLKPKDVYAENITLFKDPEFIRELKANQSLISLSQRVVDLKVVINIKNGEQRLCLVNIVSTYERKDKVYVIFNDITEKFIADLELSEKTAVYEALIHNSFDGIDIIQYSNPDDKLIDGQLIVRNDIMTMLLDNKGSMLFDNSGELESISPDIQSNGIKTSDLLDDYFNETLTEGQALQELDIVNERSQFRILASQIVLEIQGQKYLIKNYRDITSEWSQKNIITKQLEVLNSKNDELKKYIESNLQLENFAFIASHDLKAPIRSVISFSQLLRNNTKGILDDKNARFLDIVISASTNMQVLIDDLLAFSKVNTQEIEFENVDIKTLIERLLVEIGQNIEEKNGKVVVNEMPQSIVADASRLRQVFQNLITNGMKFHKDGEVPLLEIECEEQKDHFLFSVRDHGIGIETNYQNEIFLMFKKLHSENKYKGTGIGLSICKKIIEQHEGDIWVDSKLGEGSCFYFTVNKGLVVNI